MSSKELKYIGFYNDDKFNMNENRNTSLAVKNKMDYISSALVRNGFEVKIISPCWSNNAKGFYKGKEFNKSKNIIIKNFASYGSRNKLLNKIKKIFSAIQLLLYLLIETKKNEEIIVYHSLALMIPIKIAKKIKRLSIILEVEEIYSTVWKGIADEEKEINYINSADKAIFASDFLEKLFENKKSVVVYGSYNYYEKKIINEKKEDIIDIVYAGSIDKTKGGAKNSVLSMNYLPDNYRLHVLGFGSQIDLEDLQESIEALNNKKGFECSKFYGSLDGDAYSEFLSKCDIGINPQKEGEYMDSAFPSKVLSYLSHGLKVVSTDIKSVKNSKVSAYIVFTKSDQPESISVAVKSIKLNENNNKSNKNIVKELDKEFVQNIRNLFHK